VKKLRGSCERWISYSQGAGDETTYKYDGKHLSIVLADSKGLVSLINLQ
jgi:hypothetical protein